MKNRLFASVTILILASMLLAGTAFAQKQQGRGDSDGGPPSSAQKLDRLSAELDLSDQQELEMLEILQKKEADRERLREQFHAQMGPEICAQMMETEEEILAILDQSQAEQFLQMKEERRIRAQERNHYRNRMGPPDCSQYEDSGN
jgi:hypothetical protein